MAAIFRGDADRLHFTPTADIGAGDVVVVGNIVGVTTLQITKNTIGEIQIGRAFYDVPVSSVTATAGSVVSVTGKLPDGTSSREFRFGYATSAIASTDTSARILFDPAMASEYLRDNIAPVVSLIGDTSVSLANAASWIDPGATAVDNQNGTLTPVTSYKNGSTVKTAFDSSEAGTWTITYTATDSAGNTGTATRTVTVASP